MGNQINKFIAYIYTITGCDISCREVDRKGMPIYLTQVYCLYDLFVGQDRYLGVFLKDSTGFRPASYEKHLTQLFKLIAATPNGACLMASSLPTYVRNRLVERGLSFVVPDTQLFWPELGAAVKARPWSRAPEKVAMLSPVGQAVILYVLNQNHTDRYTPKDLAEVLDYSNMSMTRALNEIEANQIGVVTREGKERCLVIEELLSVWQKALPYLRSPVREEIHISKVELNAATFFVAGESALAAKSLLVPPNEPIFAIDENTWKSIANNIQRIPIQDVDTCLVQIWRYNPLVYAHNNQVDDFSLYLSLKNHHDERINIALNELMEKRLW
jgi:hypothetical protein